MSDHLTLEDLADMQPRKRGHREWIEQRTDNAFLSKALPIGAYFTAIDVGRSTNAKEGFLRKLRGVKAGIPDWLIVWNGITLWIERKAGSALTPAQKVTRDYLLSNGHLWALAHSTSDVEAALREAGIPLRATYGERPAAPAKKRAAPRKAGPRNTATVAWGRRQAGKGIRV